MAANLDHWAGEADEVRTAVARRSDTADLLAPAKAAHAEYVAASRAAMAAQSGTPRRAPRPFAGPGSITRSEPPVDCPECQAAGCSWEESVLIHHDASLAKAGADQDHAERYQRVGVGGRDYVYDKDYREISRCR